MLFCKYDVSRDLHGVAPPLVNHNLPFTGSTKHTKIQLLNVDNRMVLLSTNEVLLTTDFISVDNRIISVVNKPFRILLIL